MRLQNLLLAAVAIVLVGVVVYVILSPEEVAEGPGTVEQGGTEPAEESGAGNAEQGQ